MHEPAGPHALEIINPNHLRGPFRCVVFDFDGTLSLLRGDWQGLMVPPMVETLVATGTSESRDELTAIVEEFVTRLTGQPTMQQMIALCDEVEKRGRPRPSAEEHLERYLALLIARTQSRIAELEARRTTPERMLVPGARPLVERLSADGWLLAIASGTELSEVRRESTVLKIDHFFGPRIYGPVNNDVSFSKELVLRQLMAEHDLRGDQIVAIGDGPAEIRAIKAVGGLAIGVASDEVQQDGRINPLKREHLLRAGADAIVPDYRDLPAVFKVMNVAA